jgi:hypothetical protein
MFDIGKFKNDLGWSYYCWILIILYCIILGTKYFGRHFSVTSKQINVNQALTSSQ